MLRPAPTVAVYAEGGERAVILFKGCPQLVVFLFVRLVKRKRFAVCGVGVQIQCQLVDSESQCLQLSSWRNGPLLLVTHVQEGKIQSRE